jgi:uncharacterized protein YcaQ
MKENQRKFAYHAVPVKDVVRLVGFLDLKLERLREHLQGGDLGGSPTRKYGTGLYSGKGF